MFDFLKRKEPAILHPDPDAISYSGLMPVYGVPNYKWYHVSGENNENFTKRDRFLLTISSLSYDNTITGRHDTTGWPDFDDDSGATQVVYDAFRIPEETIPDDIYSAVKEYFEYFLVRNTRYHSDYERQEKRPSWLPADWKFS